MNDQRNQQSRRTREQLLAQQADQEVLVIGTHFATPTAGWVKPLADGGYYLDVSDSSG